MTVVEEPVAPTLPQKTPRRGPRRLLGRDWRDGWLLVGPMVLLVVLLIGIPFADAIRLSFTNRHGADFVFTGLSNYRALLGDPFFRVAVKNTFEFTAYSEVFKVTFGLFAALLLHHLRRGKAVLTGLMLLPWVIPTVVTAVTWRSILDPIFGGLNQFLTSTYIGPLLAAVHLIPQWPVAWLADPHLAMASVITVNVWKGIPFFTVNFLAGLKAIDAQQYEAASIDGANSWQRFRHVTLPGLRYVMLVSVLLSSMWTFNNFDVVWLMTQGGPGSSTALYTLYSYQQAIQQLQQGIGSAASMLLLPISAVLIIVLARYMIPGGSGPVRFADRFFDRYGKTLLTVFLALVAVGLFFSDQQLIVKAAVVLLVVILLARGLGRLSELLTVVGRTVSRKNLLNRVPQWIGLALMLFFILAPLYWMIVTAFKSETQATVRSSLFWPQPWTTDQFQGLMNENPFGLWFRNTIIVSVTSTVVSVLLAALAAYSLTRLRFRGGRTITWSVLLTYMMPGSLLFIPLYAILSTFHVINSLWALIITYPTFTLPFACWFMMGYLRGIPSELEEAAMTDGASRLRAFRSVVLPLMKPGLLAVALFTLTNAWNEFLLAFVFLTDNDVETLPVGLQSMIVGDVVPWGQLSAASILVSIPVVVAYGYAQRFLVEGLAVGAVKA
jgi:multiple sugar transport system permease protein